MEKYRHRAVFLPNAAVRLTDGEAGMAALRRDVDSLVAPGIPVLDLHDTSRRVTTTLAVESFALYVIALALTLAGGLLVAQVLSRSTSFIGHDVATLRSIGMTRRADRRGSHHEQFGGDNRRPGRGAGGRRGPVAFVPPRDGAQRRPRCRCPRGLDCVGSGPRPHCRAPGRGTVFLAFAASSREARHVAGQRSAVAAWLARVGPVPVGIGARMALERGPGARSMPVRPALVGAVIGVLGVVGALTINAAIHHALDNPALAGVTWGASVTPPPAAVTSSSVSGLFLAAVGRAAPGGSVAVVRRDLVDVDGVGVPTFSVQDEGGCSPVTLAMVSGHAPTARDEAAIGPATATSLGVRLGDWVVIGHGQKVHLVGEALFPSDVHSEFDEGLWLTTAEFDSEAPPPLPSVPDEVVAVRFTAGNQEKEAISAAEADVTGNPISTGPIGQLTARLGLPVSALNSDVEPVNVPLELTNLEDLSQLPIVLGAFLAVLGLAALSYVLVVSGRSRRAEFAIYKALGLDGKMSRRIVYFQASVIATIGLVIGVPLGIIIGSGVGRRSPPVSRSWTSRRCQPWSSSWRSPSSWPPVTP